MPRARRRHNPDAGYVNAALGGALLGATAAAVSKYAFGHRQFNVFTFDPDDYSDEELESGYAPPRGMAAEKGTRLELAGWAAAKGAAVGAIVGLVFATAARTSRKKNPSKIPNPLLFGSTAAVASVLATHHD